MKVEVIEDYGCSDCRYIGSRGALTMIKEIGEKEIGSSGGGSANAPTRSLTISTEDTLTLGAHALYTAFSITSLKVASLKGKSSSSIIPMYAIGS